MEWAGHVARVGRGADRVLVGKSGLIRNLIRYGEEVDTDNKLNNCLKITGNINSTFRPQKALKKTRINYTVHWPFQLCYTVVKIGPLQQETQEENSSRDELYK